MHTLIVHGVTDEAAFVIIFEVDRGGPMIGYSPNAQLGCNPASLRRWIGRHAELQNLYERACELAVPPTRPNRRLPIALILLALGREKPLIRITKAGVGHEHELVYSLPLESRRLIQDALVADGSDPRLFEASDDVDVVTRLSTEGD